MTPMIVSSSPSHTFTSGWRCWTVPWLSTTFTPGPAVFTPAIRPFARGMSDCEIFAALKTTTCALPPRFALIQIAADQYNIGYTQGVVADVVLVGRDLDRGWARDLVRDRDALFDRLQQRRLLAVRVLRLQDQRADPL